MATNLKSLEVAEEKANQREVNFQATEEEKELKSKREPKTLFIEETLKDGLDVNN